MVAPLEGWLRKQITANAPYDRMVRGLLTDANAAGFLSSQRKQGREPGQPDLSTFPWSQTGMRPVSRRPFRRNVETAQFWEYAAFFTGLRTENGRLEPCHGAPPAGCGACPHPDRRYRDVGGGTLPGRRRTGLATSRHTASSAVGMDHAPRIILGSPGPPSIACGITSSASA